MECAFVKDLGMFYPENNSNRKYRYYLVTCPYCGKDFKTLAGNFKSGIKSCRDCKSKIRDLSIYYRKHGLSGSPVYRVWADLKSRCKNKKDTNYEYYGGRGIRVCDEWADDFKSFYDWSIKNGYKKGLEIDRINNDKNYEPGNCRYVTHFINASNRRTLNSRNTSGFRGVYVHGRSGKFCARITTLGSTKHLGVFDTAEQASEAYEAARTEKYKNIIEGV